MGDAPNFTDAAQGGNDWITTVNSVNDVKVYADAYLMFGESRGGNDRIDGDAKTAIYGDALVLNDSAAGGDDVLEVRRFGEGDASLMYQSVGGDDVLAGRKRKRSALRRRRRVL